MCVEYECDHCRRVHSVHTGPVAYYTLPDGRGFFGPHGVGWCSLCRRLTEVEAIGGADFEHRLEFMTRLPAYTVAPELESHCQLLAEWARMRTQPPRCLRCGSAHFLPLWRGPECLFRAEGGTATDFRHPGCGGRFLVKEVLFSQPIPNCLSAEGELLAGRWDGPFMRWARRLWT